MASEKKLIFMLTTNRQWLFKLTVAPGIINLGNAFVFHFGIMSSLIINVAFSAMGMASATKTLAPPPQKK